MIGHVPQKAEGFSEQVTLDKRLTFQSPSSQSRPYVVNVNSAVNNIGKQKAEVAYEHEGTAHALQDGIDDRRKCSTVKIRLDDTGESIASTWHFS